MRRLTAILGDKLPTTKTGQSLYWDKAVASRLLSPVIRNLLTYPYDSTTLTSRGITWTDNKDGTVTVNGKNDGTGNSVFYLASNIVLEPGTYTAATYSAIELMVYITRANGSQNYVSGTFTINAGDTVNNVYLQVANGTATEYSNTVAYPQIERGGNPTGYQRLYLAWKNAVGIKGATFQNGVPSPNNPIPIQCVKQGTKLHVCGKNLFNVTDYSVTRNGVTVNIENNIVTLNGTASGYTELTSALPMTKYRLEAGNYIISMKVISGTCTPVSGTYTLYTGIATQDDIREQMLYPATAKIASFSEDVSLNYM